MSRKVILIIAIPSMLAVVCIVLLVVSSTVNGNDRATKTAAATQFETPLKALCTGQAGGVAGAATYTAGAGVHPMLAFRTLNGTNYNRDSRVGTDTWAAKTLGEAQLVLCEEDTSVLVEACPYTIQSTGTTRTLNRMQNQLKLRLIAAKTGQVVASQTLLGTKPRECMEQESFPSGTATMSVSGDAVTVTDIQSWLRTYVAP